MTQLINIKSDGTFSIAFGLVNLLGTTSDDFLPAQLLVKMRVLHDRINEVGISELHVEKDAFREFEHARVAADTITYDFGTNVTEEEFEAIMALSEMFD